MLSRNSILSAADVGNIIRSTAKPLRDNPADPVPNDNYGSGLVQAGAAVAAAFPRVPWRSENCVIKTVDCPGGIPEIPERFKSRLILCESTLVGCPGSSERIACLESIRVICPVSNLISTCEPQQSLSPGCLPQSLADCPSFPCPQSLECGLGGRGRRSQLGARWDNYDPHGYDPYGSQYT
jgi:hypothetical protein